MKYFLFNVKNIIETAINITAIIPKTKSNKYLLVIKQNNL